jgi:hypothetical protein
MDLQNLTLVIIREITLLRFGPLQRDQPFHRDTLPQQAALAAIRANCLSDTLDLRMRRSNEENSPGRICRHLSIEVGHRAGALGTRHLPHSTQFLKFLEPTFGRIPYSF